MAPFGFIPFMALLLLVGHAWPSALPAFLAYFIIGAGMAVFWNWAFRKGPQAADLKFLPATLWLSFYAWPVNVILVLNAALKPKKGN